MPGATESVNFTWSLPSLTCSHGVGPDGADFRGEFFQKVKETKTTLDRIYLSSLTRNKDKAVIYDYEKWARKGGVPVGRNLGFAGAPSSGTKQPTRPGPVRPLGIDNKKIEAALQCGLWDEHKQKKTRIVKMPHIMARVQCYDFDDNYKNDTLNHQGAEYALDSSKVFRVMQEETREQATHRLKKGKCGSLKKRSRRISPSDQVSESDDEYTSSEVTVTIEQKHSKRRGDVVTNVTHKQKLDFSTIKKRGVTQSDTVDYRLPKLNSKPIPRESEEQLSNEEVLKLPLLECLKKGSSTSKKKRSKRCKKLSRNKHKKKPDEEGEESFTKKNIDDDVETALDLQTPILEDVTDKLSDISHGKSGLYNNNKSGKNKLYCKKETDDDGLSDYPFLSMGMDELSESDEECLCDECLELMASSKQPLSGKKPLKSILSPRRRKKRTNSTGSGKSVSFAQTEDLEDVRIISSLAVRNENTKKFEEEERRERLKQRDMKRRERRQRERERFAALNQKSTKKKDAQRKTDDDPEQTLTSPETTSSPPSETERASDTNEDKIEAKSNEETSTEIKEEDTNKDASQESLTSENELQSDNTGDSQISSSPNVEPREVEALLLDPNSYGRLYEDTVLERGNGKITVAQLGYRIKSIFDRDLPPPASPKPSPTTSSNAEIIDQAAEKTASEDEVDDCDRPFVTKCVDWNETTESAATSRSPTPVEKTDMSEFIMSMKNCRYLRWSKSYTDMLEMMEQ